MTITSDLPISPDFLTPNNFRFDIQKLPVFSSLVTKVTVPAIVMQAVAVATPMRPIMVPGNPVKYSGGLQVVYKLDENLQSYITIERWMKGLSITDSPTPVINLDSQPVGNTRYSIATLTLQTAQKNDNVVIEFTDVFPTSQGGFDVSVDVTDVNYVATSASFSFQSFKVWKLGS